MKTADPPSATMIPEELERFFDGFAEAIGARDFDKIGEFLQTLS